MKHEKTKESKRKKQTSITFPFIMCEATQLNNMACIK